MSVRDELDELQLATKTINSQQWVTGCGLVLPDRMTAKDHTVLAIHLGTMGDAASWGRGDQFNRIKKELEKQYGKKTDKYNEALAARRKELAALYRVEEKTVENNATTADKWLFKTRWQTPNIGYGHHAEMNHGFTDEERQYYMQQADAGGWSVARLRFELYEKRGATPPGISYPDSKRVTDLFKWAGVPAIIEENCVSWRTPQGTIRATSDSPIRWEVENETK
jgi:hypothetical protein